MLANSALARLVAALVVFALCECVAACTSPSSTPEMTGVSAGHSGQSVPDRDSPTSTYNLIYSFKDDPDGAFPMAPLLNINGTLYGTTFAGGTFHYGTVFSVTAAGVESPLYSFASNPNDGGGPQSGLLIDNGALWGATRFAVNPKNAYGTVFRVSFAGLETVEHRFTGPFRSLTSKQTPDGCFPYASLTKLHTLLYGVTVDCGTHGDGTIYHVTGTGSETVDYSFAGKPDGFDPGAITDVAGTLYGTTAAGGTQNAGTVFTFSPGGGESVIHSFGVGADGMAPDSDLVSLGGLLYGTTEFGGANGKGTLFDITAAGVENVVYNFGSSPTDGESPLGNLIVLDGKLYGTTESGGADGLGTVFSMTKSGQETILHSFGSLAGDGAEPFVGLINVNGTLFGTTARGGANNDGSVYSIIP